MQTIIPILLAGGSGTRLWPLSRKSYPKQFTQIINELSLFQESAIRLTSSSIIKFEQPITLTNSNFRFIVAEQLLAIGIDPGAILIEPETKNTAPAIISAAMFAYNQNDEAVLLVAPSDHNIPNKSAFHKAVKLALNKVQEGKIVSFGIKPTHPETSYGYLELKKENPEVVYNDVRFIEKPDIETATKLLASGNCLWNAGIFLFRAKDIINAFKQYEPDLLSVVEIALKKAKSDLGFLKLDPEIWSRCKEISIDYAIMEKIHNLSVVPFSAGWSDLGNWQSVWHEMQPDKNGVAISSNAYPINCNDTLLRSESKKQILVGLGLKNIIAIATPDAVFVAHKDMIQETKKVLEVLKSNNVSQAEESTKYHRPWGWFESLLISKYFQVKRIFVKSGAAISLQKHLYRSEHWIVVQGTAKVTIDDKINYLKEGQSIFIPLGAIHRMENKEKLPIELIEVQVGKYLGEDDIIRYEDLYARE
jgi:mannose-1-phosphate guanylyltransferase / mannose-6-phosphate isomerase